ncbi:GIY-YIG nuclease family protein, partial [Nocardioides caeni]
HGLTNTPNRRINFVHHATGLDRRPVRVVWAHQFDRVDLAFTFEKQIQKWGRAKRIALIEGRIDALSALSSRGLAGTEARLHAQEAGRPGVWKPDIP